MEFVLELLPEEIMSLEPPERLTVTEFAEKHIVLDATSPEPGPYRVDRTPWVKAWLNIFNDPEVETIVIQCASQVGKTTTLLVLQAYIISEKPSPTMLLYPTVEVAEDYSRTRLDPMIDNHERLSCKRRDDRHLNTVLRKQFIGMDLYIAGSNSAPSLQSKPIANLLMDEVSTMTEVLPGLLVSPVDSAVERTKAFSATRKIYMVSTPSHQYGRITEELRDCDRVFQFHVPCPHCGEYQTLKFSQVKWPEIPRDDPNRLKKIEEATHYECEHCRGRITDRHKGDMIRAGEWRTDSESGRLKKVGFQLSSLYSPWVKFGEMAVKFLKAKENVVSLRNFVNAWLGEPFTEQATSMKSEAIFALCDDRPRGQVPSDAVALVGAADVQKNSIFYVIRAFGQDMTSWLVREGQVESFLDLEMIFFGSIFPVVGTQDQSQVRVALIDSGFRTDEVYQWVRTHHGRARAIKGATHAMKAPFSPTRIDFLPNGKPLPGGLTLWMLDTGHWKDALFRRMAMNPGDPGSWRVHSEITRDYAAQMVSEQKTIIRSRKTGRVTEEWQQVTQHTPNHYWDCEQYALAGAEMLGVRNIHRREPASTPRTSDHRPRRYVNPWLGDRQNWLAR